MENNHSHDGHRNRMKNKFVENEFNNFEEHEILELLLFYSIPRKNTNEIAHDLINKFGNLSNVLNADINLLQEVNGITFNSAVLLKMIPPLCKKYVSIVNDGNSINLTNIETIFDFCINQYVGATTEILKVIYLDNSCKFISCVDICTIDSTNAIVINATRIIERAEKYKSSNFILVHNHPNGELRPSNEDRISTEKLYKVFRELKLTLIDHIIVSGSRAISMVNDGYLMHF